MKKRIINIIFYLVMIGCIFLLIYFNKDYKNINLTTKNYNKYKNYKYVTLDLREAKLNRLSYKVNDKEYYTYSIKLNNKYMLIYLNKNTALTKKVKVIKYDDDKDSRNIKLSLKNDEEDINFYKGYYSNISYESNKKLLNIKYYTSLTLIGLCSLLILVNIVLIFEKK